MRLRCPVILALCLSLPAQGEARRSATPRRADLVILGAHVPVHIHGQDQAPGPEVRAVAVAGGRIVYVGSDAGAAPFIGDGTRVIDGRIDGRGRRNELTVLPGLVDAHAHLLGLGLGLGRLDLRGKSLDAVAAAVRDGCGGDKDKEACIGRGWDQTNFPQRAMPDRAVLDRAAPGKVVWLRRIDGHAGWASTAALARAGITRATPDPPGGRILRRADGDPTGVLIDNAMDLVENVLPAPGPAALRQAILRAARHVTALGLTAVHEMGLSQEAVAAYRELARAGSLPLRVYGYAADPIPSALAQQPESAAYKAALAAIPEQLGPPDQDHGGDRPADRFQLRGIKLFLDGAMGSRGAALLRPYADEPGSSGLLLAAPGHIEAMARLGIAHGYQIATHAIGDRANRLVLDAYERAGVRPERDLRFRVEHAQIVDPADQGRFAALGVIASMQPTHATSDMAWAEARLGRERLQAGGYAWRSLLQQGARLCGGSDFPVEEPNPLLGLHAALTRQDLKGNPAGGFFPAQRLTLQEAIRLFTSDAAHAVFAEGRLGQVRPGYLADLTVLAGRMPGQGAGPAGPSGVPGVAGLAGRRVLLTVVGGAIVHDATASEAR
jgi:hypothetical protein